MPKTAETTTRYGLYLHGKQGDDFACHAPSNGKRPVSDALRLWAEDHRARTEVCLKIAEAIQGLPVAVVADTHCISFHPKNATAKRALEVLVDAKLLLREDW